MWNCYGDHDRLTNHVRLLAFAAKLCTSSGVKLLRWSPDWPRTTMWFLLRNFAPVLVWNCYGDRLTDHVWLLVFAAKLCTSSSVKLLQWSPDWPRTTIRLLLRNFTPVLVWTFYGDCLTDFLRLLAFAAKQKGPCLLSGVNVNDERGNHPTHVETRVKYRKRYLTLQARFSAVRG